MLINSVIIRSLINTIVSTTRRNDPESVSEGRRGQGDLCQPLGASIRGSGRRSQHPCLPTLLDVDIILSRCHPIGTLSLIPFTLGRGRRRANSVYGLQVTCAIYSSTQGSGQVFLPFSFLPDVSYHLACVYDGEKLCIHINNTLAMVPRLLFPQPLT